MFTNGTPQRFSNSFMSEIITVNNILIIMIKPTNYLMYESIHLS